MSTKLNTDKVLSFLVKPKTIPQVATRFKVAKTTAARFMNTLGAVGSVYTTGTTSTGQRGRPAQLFQKTTTI